MIQFKQSWKPLFLSLLLVLSVTRAEGQCAGRVSSPAAVADCAARQTPRNGKAILDPAHPYTLAELIANLTLRVERGADFAQARRRITAQEEHEAILAALESADSDAAEKAVHTHLRHQLVATTMPALTPR